MKIQRLLPLFVSGVLLLGVSDVASAQARVDRNVVYGMYSGTALLLDVHYPAKPNGFGIIFIPGSGWECFDRFQYDPNDPIVGTWKNLAPSTGNVCGQLFESFCRNRRILELLLVFQKELVELFIADNPTQHPEDIRAFVLNEGAVFRRVLIETSSLAEGLVAIV